MCTRALRRPRWAIPTTTSCAPASAPSSIASSSIGIRASRPSRENCFCPRNDRRRYCSKPSTCETTEQPDALLGLELHAEAPGLDRLAEPDALGVVGDVLDLVRARAHVDLAQPRQGLEQGLARDVEPQDVRGDARLELRGERRHEPRLVERGVAHRLRAERVEPRGQVAVHPVRLDEGHRRRDGAEEPRVGFDVGPALCASTAGAAGVGAPLPRSPSPSTTVAPSPRTRAATRPGRSRGVEVVLQQLCDVGGVRPGRVRGTHRRCCSRGLDDDDRGRGQLLALRRAKRDAFRMCPAEGGDQRRESLLRISASRTGAAAREARRLRCAPPKAGQRRDSAPRFADQVEQRAVGDDGDGHPHDEREFRRAPP